MVYHNLKKTGGCFVTQKHISKQSGITTDVRCTHPKRNNEVHAPWRILTLFVATVTLLFGCPYTAPTDTTPPSAVSVVAIDSTGDTQITLSWTNPADSDFDHIEISWDSTNDSGVKTLSAAESGNAGADASATIAELTNGTAYTFTVIAVDTSGNESSDNPSVTATPNSIPDMTPPAAVSGFVAVIDDGQVTLSWTNPADADFDHIEIIWDSTNDSGMKTLSPTDSGNVGASANAVITGLTNGADYTFTVIAVDTSGNDSVNNPSVTATPSIPDTTPPSAVSAVVVDNTGDTQITLSWTNPAESDFDHIEITWTPANNDGMKTLSPTDSGNAGASASVVIAGLTNDIEYTFTVIAVDMSGNNSLNNPSVTATPSIPDTTPPSAVSAVAVDNAGNGQVTLSWANPADGDFDHIEITWIPTGMKTLSTAESGNAGASASVVIAGLTNDIEYTFTVIAVDMSGNNSINNPSVTATIAADDDGDGVINSEDVDDDNDGLIDIYFLEDLNNIRYNLAGTSYDDEADDSVGNEGSVVGAPSVATAQCTTANDGVYLCGYELMQDLNFADSASYAGGAIITDWRPNSANPDAATNNGWLPIGDSVNPFDAIFAGNNYTISNLYVRNGNDKHVGLFGQIFDDATINAIGLINNAVYSGVESGDKFTGGLVGRNYGIIYASYVTGNANGNTEGSDNVGGLVGRNDGIIYASYATGNADGGAGINNRVGALVGYNNTTIRSSYAAGNADGGAGDNDFVGALVGWHAGGTIHSSYATGNADGGTGTLDFVGALVGLNASTINASYASGTATGELPGSAGSDSDATLTLLQSSSNSNTNEDTPFYRWTVVPDGTDADTLPDWAPSTADEKRAVYCDTNRSGNIEVAEEMVDNYVWDFGTDSELPRISCILTP